MKKFFEEFKTFITRGNIIDMSVGVIVGGAFTAIVNGLSDNILKPIINWILSLILGQDSLSGIYTFLKKVYVGDTQEIDLTNSIYIDWGAFINAIINFLIIAFVLFLIVKSINKVVDSQKMLQDIDLRVAYKQEKGLKLSKRERKYLEIKKQKEIEEKAKLEEEINKPKPLTTEDLLIEIRDLLKDSK